MSSRNTTPELKLKQFIDNSNTQFNNKFNYSKATFKTCDTNVIISCPDHGDFEMTPYKHLKSKYGCWECGKIESSKKRTKPNDTYKSQLEEKFGKDFDYSKVDYKGTTKDVIIICIKHDYEFVINAGRLLKCEFGCPECVYDNKKKLAKPLTDFIEESNKKHNYKFKDGFKDTIYTNSKTPITFNCPEDGEMTMTPHQHLVSPTGCTKCSGKYVRSEEEFDKDLKSVYDEKIKRIDPYINQHTPMRMWCEEHGEFPNKKTGSDLLNGHHQGCPRCQIEYSSEKRRWKEDEWIEKSKEIHPENKDDYSSITLETFDDTLWVHNILCTVHKQFYCQRANDHHTGHRCSKCGFETLSELFRLPYSELIERCKETYKEEKYEYDENEPEDYKNGNSKIPVRCLDHGIWYPSAHNHINGSRCPSCINKTEQKLYEKLSQIYHILERQFKKEWCKNISYLPFDFVLEVLKIIIELDGPQHFIQIMNWKSPEETCKVDIYKMKCANDNGFSVIRLTQEDVYYDTYDWLGALDTTINKIIEEQVVQNIYLCKNNEYEHFNPI